MLKQALSNKSLDLDEEQTALFTRNGFLVRGAYYRDIYDIYAAIEDEENLNTDGPIFISADLYLHSLHRLADYTIRLAEQDYLLPSLEKLTAGLLGISLKEYGKAKGDWKKAWALNTVYLAIASSLLEKDLPQLPTEISSVVDAELRLIEAHEGIEKSPAFGVESDYSQFVPRGHYTVNPDLERYFMAMMWIGRTGFSLVPLDPIQARAGVGMSVALHNDKNLQKLWSEMERVMAGLSGRSDDLNPAELYDLLPSKDWASLSDDDLERFGKNAAKQKPPLVLSGISLATPDKPSETPVSFRLFGQRFTPDGYFMHCLLYDRVTDYTGKGQPFTMATTRLGPQRCFVRGLDVMAALGDSLALSIIKKDGDADYSNYADQLAKIQKWWDKESKDQPVNNASFYDRWFALLDIYLDGAKAPPLASPDAWHYKALVTSLGSWAQVKHDFILYAKQPYGAKAAGAAPFDEPPPPHKDKFKRAYLEDAEAVYSKGALACEYLAGLLPNMPAVAERCKEFADISRELANLAVKQRKGLSEQEHFTLWGMPSYLSVASRYDWEIMNRISHPDEEFPLVADVMTDPNTEKCLEVGVGDPAWIGVLVEIDGKPYIAEGAVFTYYEFKQPIQKRLTDEDWQDMEPKPDMPKWVSAIGSY